MSLKKIITGKTKNNLLLRHNPNNGHFLIHKKVARPLQQMINSARNNGIELNVASGHRSFERQCLIWNEKAQGKRPILDNQGNLVDIKKVSAEQLLFLILRWSAIPGFSRHHWGTDIDVVDFAPLRKNPTYKILLTPEETTGTGIFAPLHSWLDKNLGDFYRPYEKDLGGIHPERWHLSYRPLAERFENLVTLKFFRQEIKKAPILLKSELLNNSEEIFYRFVKNQSR